MIRDILDHKKMKTLVSTKYFIIIVITLICFFLLSGIFSSKAINYETLNQKWKMEALSKVPVKDPRSDSDQLRPVVNYDNEIIQIHSFEKKRNWVRVGEGWQLVGGVVDIISHHDSIYILYGRKNLRYEGGFWNNVLNTAQSFQDYLVIKRQGNQAEVIIAKKLIPTTSQILIGLSKTDDGKGFQIIQTSPQGQLHIIESYQF